MGISNREWLYSLDVADLAEWFDAEHVDDAISENLGLSQDSEIDSREKLEADVRQLAFDYAPSLDSSDEYALRAKVMKLLDRQVAITKAEQREWWGGVVAELQERVDELERDNADLIRDLKEHKDYLDGWDMASAMWILRKYQDGELLRKCDAETISLLDNEELQAKVTELQIQLEAMSDVANDYRYERDELQDRVDTLTRYIHEIKQIARKV